jgi:hypothetical protein
LSSHLPWSIELDKGYSLCNGVIEVLFSECQHSALQGKKEKATVQIYPLKEYMAKNPQYLENAIACSKITHSCLPQVIH